MPKANGYDRQQARRTAPPTVRQSLVALVLKMDQVAADPQFQAMAIMATIHGQPYTGPNWAEELATAKRALARTVDHRKAMRGTSRRVGQDPMALGTTTKDHDVPRVDSVPE